MEDTLSSLSTWGYLALAFFSFGGGWVVIVAAGVLSFLGKMDLILSFLIAVSSNFIGDLFLFYIGRYHKSDIRNYLKSHTRKIALATIFLRKYGVWAIFIKKFIYGVKTIVPITMAISKYDFKKFAFYNIFATLFFVAVVLFGSYWAGESIKLAYERFQEYPWIFPLFLFAIIGGIWFVMEKITAKDVK
ncbi:MAG: DedA family protein [Epsilonproteobacteria bacterium]|nr:DedA family protein [Campylobacterota bacterium]